MRHLSCAAVVAAATAFSATSGLALAADPDICNLITSAEFTSALGSTPATVTPEPPMSTGNGGRIFTCVHSVGSTLVNVAVMEFAGTREAAAGMKTMSEDEDLKPLPGLGDRALMSDVTTAGAMKALGVNVLSGRYILGIAGVGVGDVSKLREPLKRLAAAALGRLPR